MSARLFPSLLWVVFASLRENDSEDRIFRLAVPVSLAIGLSLASALLRAYSFDGFRAFSSCDISSYFDLFYGDKNCKSIHFMVDGGPIVCLAEMDRSNAIKCNVITD